MTKAEGTEARTSVSSGQKLLKTQDGRPAVHQHLLQLWVGDSQVITEQNFSLTILSLKHSVLLKTAEHSEELLLLYSISLDFFIVLKIKTETQHP